jgi:hypothetical protein
MVAIGLGTLLLVLGLVFVLDVINVDSSLVDTATLGWILVGAGVLAIVVSLVASRQRSQTTVVEERRHRA